jgi:hypothetical protein
MPTIQELANDLHSLLTASGCDRKGDVAARAITLAQQAGLTSPNWSGFSNGAATNPEVPDLKDTPDDNPQHDCVIKAGYRMLMCYLDCLSAADAHDCVWGPDGCNDKYCAAVEECVGV